MIRLIGLLMLRLYSYTTYNVFLSWSPMKSGVILSTTLFAKTFRHIHIPSIEPRHDKTSNVAVRPAKTQISLGLRPVWSESSLSAWRNLRFLATHWAQAFCWFCHVVAQILSSFSAPNIDTDLTHASTPSWTLRTILENRINRSVLKGVSGIFFFFLFLFFFLHTFTKI